MKKDLFILSGPTAIGKTDISIKLAKLLDGEIISADSMQIYKHMDIGSAKINKNDMDDIPHHLIDFVDPRREFSVSEFASLSKEKIEDIKNRGHLPMLVGGTGLYLDSLIFNYNFAESNRDEEYREYLRQLAEEKGKEHIHQMLKDVDLESYNRLSVKDLKRNIRALEVYKTTGKTIREINEERDIYDIPYNIYYYVLNMNRNNLYERINKRVDIMLEQGLIDEVKDLISMGLSEDTQSMKGIGYKEIIQYLKGEISYEEAVYLIKKGTRNYAKRQLTWFRKDKRVIWVDKDDFSSEGDIINYIYKDFLKRKIN